MAVEKVIDIKINAQSSIETLGQLQKKLADLTLQLEETDKGSDAFNELTKEINKTTEALQKNEGAFGEARDTFKTLSGGPVERVTASFGLLKEGILGLDFGKFKTGLKGVTTAFGGLGKAIIATGIGALVILVVKLIQNFDALSKAGGVVGKIFGAIGDVVNTLKDGIIALTNSWGLTAIANDEATESLKKYKQEAADLNATIEQQVINQRRLDGEITEFEARRLKAIQDRNVAEREAERIKDEAIKAAEEAADETTSIAIDAARNVFEKTKQAIELRYDNEVKEANKAEEQKTKNAVKAEEDRNKKLREEREKEAERRRQEERKNLELIRSINETFLRGERDKLIKERDEQLNQIKGNTLEAELARENIIKQFAARIAKLRLDAIKKEVDEVKLTIKENPLPPLVIPVDEDATVSNFERLFLKINDVLKKIGNETIGIYADITDVIASNRQTDLNIEATQLEAQFARRRQYIEENVRDETQRANQLRNLDGEIARSRDALEKRQLELDKQAIKRERNITIATIALNTAIAIAAVVKNSAKESADPVTLVATILIGIGAVVAAMVKANNALKGADASIAAVGAGGGGGGGAQLPSTGGIGGGGGGGTPFAPNQFALFGTAGSSNNLGQNQGQLIQAYVVEADITSVQRRINRFRTASEI